MGYWDKKNAANKGQEENPQEEDTLEKLEKETLEELGDVEKSFRERMNAESKRFRDMCDTEYWFCVCFTSREQKEEFLKKIGMETDVKYIDGKDMARAYRKAIKTPDLDFAKVKPYDKEYCNRARDL
jgi:hypothetical protein|nr:MAG TPA: Regulatory protein E2 barrel, DNA BINDING PROTEIN.8A [Caudoviricetes sp.]